MIKILGVFNEITNTTIPIENFNLLSENKYEKHAFSYFTKEAKPVTATFDIADNGKELVVKVNKLPLKEGANNSNNYLYFHFTNAEGALKSYTVLEVNEKIVTSFLKSEIKGKYTTLRVHYNGYTLTKDLN